MKMKKLELCSKQNELIGKVHYMKLPPGQFGDGSQSFIFNGTDQCIVNNNPKNLNSFEKKETYKLLNINLGTDHKQELELKQQSSGSICMTSNKNSSFNSIRNYTELYIDQENMEQTSQSDKSSLSRGQNEGGIEKENKSYSKILSTLDEYNKETSLNYKKCAKSKNDEVDLHIKSSEIVNGVNSRNNYTKLNVSNHLKIIQKENLMPNIDYKKITKKTDIFTI
jgi:hypothetical protein